MTGKRYSLSAHSLNGRFQSIKKFPKIYLLHLEGGLILYAALGTGQATKTDEFSENFQGGGVIFNPKIYVADFGPLYRAVKWVWGKKLQYDFLKMMGGVKGCLELLRKFIRFGGVRLPLPA